MMTNNDVFLRALRQIESVHTVDDRLRDVVGTESILLERLSKQELFEKAVKLYYEDCEGYRGNGTCASGLKCEDCESVKIYKRKLMER